MANSETNICNLALSLSGNNRILSLTAESEEANVCELLYAPTRDEVLAHSGVNWNIAKARAELTETTEPDFGWDHAFTLPSDLLRVIAQVTDSRDRRLIPWQREGNTILTNDEDCYILYIKMVTDPVQFPPILYEAIYTKLAAKLATRLSKNPQRAQELMALYVGDVLPRARRANNEESYVTDEMGNDDWITEGRGTLIEQGEVLPGWAVST